MNDPMSDLLNELIAITKEHQEAAFEESKRFNEAFMELDKILRKVSDMDTLHHITDLNARLLECILKFAAKESPGSPEKADAVRRILERRGKA